MKQNNSKHTQGIYEVGIAEQTYGTTFIEVREGTIEINSSEGALIALCGNERNAEAQANAERICTAVNGYDALLKSNAELFQMVRDLKKCINRLCQDGVTQEERDLEAYWEGEAHELLLNINPNYFKNANETESAIQNTKG